MGELAPENHERPGHRDRQWITANDDDRFRILVRRAHALTLCEIRMHERLPLSVTVTPRAAHPSRSPLGTHLHLASDRLIMAWFYREHGLGRSQKTMMALGLEITAEKPVPNPVELPL